MAVKMIFVALSISALLVQCAGLAALAPANSAINALEDDAASLLQAQMELKRDQAAVFEEDEEAGYSSKACGPADICNRGQLPASFKNKLLAGEPVQAEWQESIGLKPEASSPETVEKIVADTPEASKGMTGTVLQALALLLIMDCVRRHHSSKGKISGHATVKTSSKAVTQAKPDYTQLLAAALAGDDGAFEVGLRSASGKFAQHVDNWGCSALHYAAKGGSASIVKKTLELGARVDALDVWDETPLHLAARAGHAEVCEALLVAGAQIDAANAEDCTPLILAGRVEREVICKLLIARGAGVVGLSDEISVPAFVTNLLAQKEADASM